MAVLEEVFRERGPVDEILMDNASIFRSAEFRQFLQCWNVRPWYRAAYRASGNGIVERHHRTVKAIAERASISPLAAVFWYNCTPKSGQSDESVPYKSVSAYEWRPPEVEPPKRAEAECELRVGEEVWIKPPDGRCTSKWGKGVVTEVNSSNNVSVDGMPRHILDLRPAVVGNGSTSGESLEDQGDVQSVGDAVSQGEEDVDEPRYPTRERRPPSWLSEYHR